jgi:hypothetical protein
MTELFAPVCSITTTKRRRFFWAAWWSGPPTRVPFKRPDASDGGASTLEEALLAAEQRAGAKLVQIDPLWARAWMRVLRGEAAWPSKASREPRGRVSRAVTPEDESPSSVWQILGVTRDVTEAELKAAYRRRILETHPDQGGDEQTLRRVVQAYAEAQRRLRKPRPKTATTTTKAKKT